MKKIVMLMMAGALLSSCGRSFSTREWVAPAETDDIISDDFFKAADDVDQPYQGENKDPDQITNKTYVVENQKQKFYLKGLGHLLWSHFECDAEMTAGKYLKTGKIRIGFDPEFQVTWESATDAIDKGRIANTFELCGQKSEEGNKVFKAVGSLTKDNEKNRYQITYTLNSPDIMKLMIIWPADQNGRGDLLCRTTSGEVIHKATLSACVLQSKKIN